MISKHLMDNVLHLYGRLRASVPVVLRRPLGVFCSVTGRCNLRCTYCWQREDESREEGKAGWVSSVQAEMTPDEWTRLVERMPGGMFLGLTGGEVTISEAFEPMLRTAAERRIPVTVNSNGATLRTKGIELLLALGVRNLSISLDGFAGVHDRVRQLPGLFDRIVANIGWFNAARGGRSRPALTIKTVLLDDNLGELLEFRRFCAETLKASCLNLSFAKVGDHAQLSLLYHDRLPEMLHGNPGALYPYKEPQRLRGVLAELLAGNATSSCRVTLYPQMHDDSQVEGFLAHEGRGPYRACFLPWSMVWVLPDGTVTPCLSYWLGNVREHGMTVLGVLRGERYRDFLYAMKRFGDELPPACRVCCYARVRREKGVSGVFGGA
ncbi:MAG: radical SAM protein [Magnetococcales bacterium]|nr:radical SAM protein [Magnetococcales bacterium]